MAELVVDDPDKYRRGGRWRSTSRPKVLAKATLPIAVRSRPVPAARAAEMMAVAARTTSSTRTASVRTQRLLPGRDAGKLTLRERVAKLFQRKSVPVYVFKVKVDCARAVQLGGEEPLSLRLRVSAPLPDRTTPAIRNGAQTIRVVSLCLSVWAVTSFEVDHWRRPVECHRVQKDSLGGVLLVNWMKEDGWLPFVINNNKGDDDRAGVREQREETVFDIGAAFDLRFTSGYMWCNGQAVLALNALIHPDFTTYNIKRRYVLKWDMVLMLAGELVSCNLDGAHDVTFIAPPPPAPAKGEELCRE